jgi:hypothetical protein
MTCAPDNGNGRFPDRDIRELAAAGAPRTARNVMGLYRHAGSVRSAGSGRAVSPGSRRLSCTPRWTSPGVTMGEPSRPGMGRW